MSDTNEHEYIQHGLESLESGDYNSAQVFFKQAIRVNNNNEDAWLNLAKTYPTEPEKALKCYENVLKINPLNAEAARMVERLSASVAPADAGFGAAAAATTVEAAESLRSEAPSAPKERKPLGGPNVSAPKGIDGTPEHVNLDYLVDFFQRAFKGSLALFTGQNDGSGELATSWWNTILMVVSASFLTGLFVAINGLRFGSVLAIFTVPLIITLMLSVAFGAGAFLSHWYLRTYRDASASLLDHTAAYVRVWFPATVIFAIVLLISGLTSNSVTDLRAILSSFSFSSNGLGLILFIVNVAITGYSAYLLHKSWARLYPTAGNGLWIAVLIAFVTTGIFV